MNAPVNEKIDSDQKEFVESVECLFQVIQDVFKVGASIKQALILLGSSIISPKDSYLVSFPTVYYDGQVLSRQTCINLLFKTLVSNDFLSNAKPIQSGSKLFVFFLAPRDCELNDGCKLVPKLSFKIPVVGVKYIINCQCTSGCVELMTSELSRNEEDFNLSGIEPLDPEQNAEMETSLPVAVSPQDFDKQQSCIRNQEESRNHIQDIEYIWYQTQITIIGNKLIK